MAPFPHLVKVLQQLFFLIQGDLMHYGIEKMAK